jgi:hypothetical protein
MILNNFHGSNNKNYDAKKELLIKLFKDKYINNINDLDNYKLKSDIENKFYEFLNFNYEKSHILKYIKLLIIDNDIKISKTETVCTVLKIIRNKKIINYGYIYGNVENDNVVNKYIITSNALISKDGEYKHRLVNINKINIENKILDRYYKYIIQELKNKEFDLFCDVFNIKNKKIKKHYLHKLKNKQLFIKVYLISWLVEIYNIYNKNQSINKNELYNNIMFSNKDIEIFKDYYSNDLKQIINEFIYYDVEYKLELGQKLIPFNYIQLKEYNNIIHFQWKELLINRIITNLIYNSNSTCFSIFIDWFLIQNSNKNLYDNVEIYKKILYSDKIKEILNYLYLAKNNLIELKSFSEKEKLINTLLMKLKKIIKDSESGILMSNISLCYFSEYSGKTIYDYLMKLSENDKILENNNIGNLYTDYDIFSKYLFEIIYSLYCLNLKGIIHGDLHLNNITMNSSQDFCNNTNIVYDLNNDYNKNIMDYILNYKDKKEFRSKNNYLDNCFIFKHYGTYPCIIDFSRSFLLVNIIDEDIIEKEKNRIRNNYIKNEKKRIINELNKIFPNYIKNNSHKIKFLFKNKNFNVLFLYFSAYDIFTFSTNLLIFIKKISINKSIKVNDKIFNLLTNISKKSYYYLEHIIDENNYNLSEKNFQFPNYLLLKEFFSEYIVKKHDIKKEIVNLFNLDNINKYQNLEMIKYRLKEDLNNFIKKETNTEIKNILTNRFNNITTYDKNKVNELDIEKIINNEYYKIKSNLHIVTSSLNQSFDTTYDVTTNSISISN